MSKAEELGLLGLGINQTLAEQIAAAQKQREIERTMAGAIADSRAGNIHCQSTSMLPARPPEPELTRGSGWAPTVPLGPPPGMRECEALMNAEDAEWRAQLAARLKK